MNGWLLPLIPMLALLSACVREAPPFDISEHPLMVAAAQGDLAEVNRLIASGADVDGKDASFNPLSAAVAPEGRLDIVRALLAAGANPDGRRGQREVELWGSPLVTAAYRGDIETSRLLLEAGASLNAERYDPVMGNFPPAIFDLLTDYGFDLQAVDGQGCNPLHVALKSPMLPRTESVEYLIQAGVPLAARDADGKTPLYYWQQPRDFEIVDWRTWIISAVLGERGAVQKLRKQRTKITEILTSAGATL
jgi:ankyrin repeat protein